MCSEQKYPSHKLLKDMTTYKWEVGTLYETREDFKDVIIVYAEHSGQDLYFAKLDNLRVRVKCAGVKDEEREDCEWEAYARKIKHVDSWQLRTIHNHHSCSRTFDVSIMSSKWLGQKMGKKVKDNPKIRLADIIDNTREK